MKMSDDSMKKVVREDLPCPYCTCNSCWCGVKTEIISLRSQLSAAVERAEKAERERDEFKSWADKGAELIGRNREEILKLTKERNDLKAALTGRTVSCVRCNELAKLEADLAELKASVVEYRDSIRNRATGCSGCIARAAALEVKEDKK